MICNISSHLVGCLFTLDTVFFDILFKKIFFMKSKLSFFFYFSYLCLWCHSQEKLFQVQSHDLHFPQWLVMKHLSCFILRVFIISGLHLGPWFTFELIFVYGVESTFILLHMNIQFSQHFSFVKKWILSLFTAFQTSHMLPGLICPTATQGKYNGFFISLF